MTGADEQAGSARRALASAQPIPVARRRRRPAPALDWFLTWLAIAVVASLAGRLAGLGVAAEVWVARAVLQSFATEPVLASTPARTSVEVAPGEHEPPSLPARTAEPEVLAAQETEYHARTAKSVLALQRWRRTTSIEVRAGGDRAGSATLVELNPQLRDWYVLELSMAGQATLSLHLENADPRHQALDLDPAFPAGIVIERAEGRRLCPLWADPTIDLAAIARAPVPYWPVCGGQVLVRQRVPGARTAREWGADWLRGHVWGGEKLTVLVRDALYADSFLATPLRAEAGSLPPPDGRGGPAPAATRGPELLLPRELGIDFASAGPILAGHWYPSVACPAVSVSALVPGMVGHEVFSAAGERLRELDPVEREALVYLVAFDLERLDLGFALGTDHPGVGWSEALPAPARDGPPPGPDGVGDLGPLAPAGIVPPGVASRVVATFAGGFKRAHGAFRRGALARKNGASHYGFIEGGAVLSKLVPDLATLLVLEDGRVEMKTWSAADDAHLSRVRYARQNGVALVESDPATGDPVPGRLVASWGEGNWSGSKDSKLRTVRAGACLQEGERGRFLLYGYFSSATPSAMARVFAAYRCNYAMHLDMNALEHTYMALYRRDRERLEIEHLIRGMEVLEPTSGGVKVPRFLGYPDNRDFFYVWRKSDPDVQAPDGLQPDPGGRGPIPSRVAIEGERHAS